MIEENENALLSIGGLSKACDIPVETLRNWERRYGFPVPVRLMSGHRRYPPEIISRLRQIRRALENGCKPSFAVPATADDLSRVVPLSNGDSLAPRISTSPTDPGSEVDRWLGHVSRMDAIGLETALGRALSIYGARQFILSLALPFMREIGERWFDGRCTVGHEHLASETLQSMLASQWRHLSSRSRGPKFVLANFEGELHSLGIHMAAVFVAMHDMRTVFLGPNTPVEDIITASRLAGVVAVVIGLSASSDAGQSITRLEEIRKQLPDELIAVMGGNETISTVEGVVTISTFRDFDDWLDRLQV